MKVSTKILILWCAAASFLHCTKDLQSDSNQHFPIALKLELLDGTTTLSWRVLSGVQPSQYIVVCSLKDSIPTGANPMSFPESFNNSLAFQVARLAILDGSTTTYIDPIIGRGSQIYYKIYVQLEGRFIESNSVLHQPQSFTIPTYSDYAIDEANHWYVTATKNDIIVYDYITGKELSTYLQNTLLYNAPKLAIGNEGGQKMLIVYVKSNLIQRFLLPGLELLGSIQTSEFYSSGFAHKGIFAYTSRTFSSALGLRRQNTLEPVNLLPNNNYNKDRRLVLLDTALNNMIEYSTTTARSHSFDATTGEVTTLFEKPFNATNIPVLLDNPVSSPNGQYFIPFTNGDIYDANCDKVFSPDLTDFKSFDFFDDNTTVGYVRLLPGSIPILELVQYNIADGTMLKKTNIKFTQGYISTVRIHILGEWLFMMIKWSGDPENYIYTNHL